MGYLWESTIDPWVGCEWPLGDPWANHRPVPGTRGRFKGDLWATHYKSKGNPWVTYGRPVDDHGTKGRPIDWPVNAWAIHAYYHDVSDDRLGEPSKETTHNVMGDTWVTHLLLPYYSTQRNG